MDEVDVLVVVAGLEVVVAGLEAVVLVVEVTGLVTFGAAVGLCAKTTEAVAQRTANVLNRFVGLMVTDLVETGWGASSLGLARARCFYLFSKASKRGADQATSVTEGNY
jgi:hypothetical protein